MATSPNRINTLLDVFDRADVLEAQTRDQILATAQALDPQRDPAVLASAVDAHLAEQEASLSPLATVTPPEGFAFPWKRPKTPEEQQKRLRRTRWLRWMEKACFNEDQRMPLLRKAFIVGFLLGGPAFTAFLYLSTKNPNQAPFAVIAVFGMMMGPILGGMTLITSQTLFMIKRFPHLPFQSALPRAEAEYLQHADTRSYLKAVLSSSIPTLLGGDVRQLEILMAAHDEESASTEARAAAERAAKQQRETAQQQAKQLAQRDTRLAALLTEAEK